MALTNATAPDLPASLDAAAGDEGAGAEHAAAEGGRRTSGPHGAKAGAGWARTAAFAAVGAVGGFAYYWFVGCERGCPLTSSPFITTGYGALLGALFSR